MSILSGTDVCVNSSDDRTTHISPDIFNRERCISQTKERLLPLFSTQVDGAAAAAAGEETPHGWVAVYVYDESVDRSEVHLIDAHTMEVSARVGLKERVPYGFHSCFVPQ